MRKVRQNLSSLLSTKLRLTIQHPQRNTSLPGSLPDFEPTPRSKLSSNRRRPSPYRSASHIYAQQCNNTHPSARTLVHSSLDIALAMQMRSGIVAGHAGGCVYVGGGRCGWRWLLSLFSLPLSLPFLILTFHHWARFGT
jgi:hypothetical protein